MRSPSFDDKGLKKGPWTQEEDEKPTSYIQKHGLGSWTALPKHAALNRCGKSCRLRRTNYLRSDIKRGNFSEEEEQKIIQLYLVVGSRWSMIAASLPERTENEIKNYWKTHLRKKLYQTGIDRIADINRLSYLSQILSSPIMSNCPNFKMNALSNNIDHSTAVLGLSSEPKNQQMIERLLSNCANSTELPSSMNTTRAFDEVVASEFVSASVPTRSESEKCGTARNYYLQEIMEMDIKYEKGCNSGHRALEENKLPRLVSVPSAETLSVNGNMASNPNSGHGSIQTLPDYDFIDGCEKLMIDDGTSGLFCKDLLN